MSIVAEQMRRIITGHILEEAGVEEQIVCAVRDVLLTSSETLVTRLRNCLSELSCKLAHLSGYDRSRTLGSIEPKSDVQIKVWSRSLEPAR
jgi:hypothetical protein